MFENYENTYFRPFFMFFRMSIGRLQLKPKRRTLAR